MNKRENQRVLLTKRLLKEGLLRLLQYQSLEKINISELCNESGINRTTFYKHYNSPQDVLSDIEFDLYQEYKVLADQSPEKNLRHDIELICTYLYEHAHIIKILLLSNADTYFANLLNELNRALWEKKNTTHDMSDLDADSILLISTFFGSGCYYLLKKWLMNEVSKTPKEIAELIYILISKETPLK